MAVARIAAIAAWRDIDLASVQLDDGGADGFKRSWIMLMPEGEFEHPQYGKLAFTRQKLAEFKKNFDGRVRTIDIALDQDHDGGKATGWLEELALRDGGLWGLVRWTSLGEQLLKDQIYRYFSPEFGKFTDPESGKEFNNVIIGGGLTNRPFLKSMPAVKLKAKFERPGQYTKGDRAKIPAEDFAGPNRTFPIVTQQDVHDAARLIGHAANPAAVKARIKAIAKRKGFSLPASWEGDADAGDAKASEGVGRHMARKRMAEAEVERDDELDEALDEQGDEDEGRQFAESDDMEYDEEDGDGPDSEGDGEDEGETPAPKGKRGKMASKRMGRNKKASEPRAQQGREGDASEVRQLREELASMRFKLYEKEVAETLSGWEGGEFQFSEQKSRRGQIGTSRVFSQKYRAFMLREGLRLNPTMRQKLNELVEAALTGAVDLTSRGSSFDQEARRTRRLSGGEEYADDQLEAEANKIALSEHHMEIGELVRQDPAKAMAVYGRAGRLVEYTGIR